MVDVQGLLRDRELLGSWMTRIRNVFKLFDKHSDLQQIPTRFDKAHARFEFQHLCLTTASTVRACISHTEQDARFYFRFAMVRQVARWAVTQAAWQRRQNVTPSPWDGSEKTAQAQI